MLMGKEALVVKRDVLFKDNHFSGFLSADKFDFIPIIMNNYFYSGRGDDLENDLSLQQIIPYVWIINPKEKKVFAYKRAEGANYREKRLQNKWSCGLGGHIESIDSGNPLISGMMRELREEVKMTNYPEPKVVGYLNLDHGVHAVHFGVVAIAETSEDVQKGDDEMVYGQFYSASELEQIFSNPENEIEEWTKASWPFVKELLT